MSGIVLNELTKNLGADDIESEHTRSRIIRSVDASQKVSSLGILQPDLVTSETLWESMDRNLNARRFLQYTANYWVPGTTMSSMYLEMSRHGQKSAHGLAVVMARSLLVMEVFYSLIAVILNGMSGSQYASVSVIILLASLLDLVCVMVSQYLNQKRLETNAHIHDQAVFDESVRISLYFLCACIATVTASSVVYCAASAVPQIVMLANLTFLLGGGAIISLSMAFNLFFLVMDLKVSSLLLDQLDILADKQALTMKVFCMVRQDIHRRVNNSKWAADFIAAPCIVSVLAILGILFTIDHSMLGLGIAWIISFLRELLFISAAFWYVAKVNGKADALTLKLSTASWLRELPDGEILELGVVESRNRYDNMVSDMQRLSVYASGLADPISFTLLFKRVSWENVAVTALGFATTVAVALIKRVAEAAESS